MEGSTSGRADARARPQRPRLAAGAVLHRDRRSADRGDAVQRSVGRLRRRLGCTQRVHHRDGRLHRLLGGLHRDGPAGHRGRRLLQLRVAWVRTDDRDGRGAAHRGLLPHLLGRRDRRYRVLREHDVQRLVRRGHPGLGVRVRHARAHGHVRVLPHRADREDPRRLPGARADRAADVRLLRARSSPRMASSWSALLPWNFFDGEGNGAEKAFGAGTIGVGIFGAFWSWIGFEMAPNYAEESKDPKRIMGPATYISVIGLGILYTFICWMLVVAWGKDGIIGRRQRAVQRRHRLGLLPARPTASSRSTSAASRCSRGHSSSRS